jgi:hypothetical protein
MIFLQLITNKLNFIKSNKTEMEQKTITNQNFITHEHLKLGAYEVKKQLNVKFSLDCLKKIKHNIEHWFFLWSVTN